MVFSTIKNASNIINKDKLIICPVLAEDDADPVSTNMIEEQIEFIAFPNPSNNVFTIHYDIEKNGILEIYNLLGQRLEQHVLDNLSGQRSVGQDWIPGIYLAKIKSGNQSSKTLKLVKQ